MELNMKNEEKQALLERLGRLLINDIRDSALSHFTDLMSGKMNDATSKSLCAEYCKLDKASVRTLERLMMMMADACFVRCLIFFDENEISIPMVAPSGESIDVRRLSGGLVGEIYSDNGWIAKYSRFQPPQDMREWYGLSKARNT
jgi:hypothetical protein